MSTHSLDELFDRDGFSRRHIGTLDSTDLVEMLQVIGVESVANLIDKTVPEAIRLRTDLDLPSALTESEVTAELRQIASMNRPRRSLIGMGYTGTITPRSFAAMCSRIRRGTRRTRRTNPKLVRVASNPF